mmetsp:Transcript_58105/g.136216  ORF Transcript_58105/g.136216 Transcript_58105/m.136216 type:complete len:337 (+) Transcript_58105:50-1060(+)
MNIRVIVTLTVLLIGSFVLASHWQFQGVDLHRLPNLQLPRASALEFFSSGTRAASSIPDSFPSVASLSTQMTKAASAAEGFLFSRQTAPDGVEFLQPVGHEIQLDIPQVHKCNPLDRMLVINLEGPGGLARRRHIIREFNRSGLGGRFKFWPAVNFGEDEDLAKELGKKKCPCDAKKGCGLSHRRIYETMLAEKWACATIFEDDVTLADNFAKRLQALVDSDSIPPFDTLQLGYCPGGSKMRHPPRDQTSVRLRYGWPGSCVHAYVVSLQGALMLTQANTPVAVPPDGAMDGMHWHKDRTRLRVDRSSGVITGSYWFVEPQMSWQGIEADNLEGGV